MFLIQKTDEEVIMYYFIVNTHARTGNAIHIWNEAKAILNKEGVSYKAFKTLFEGHATELARELTSDTSEMVNIIILGGDGTINEVVNGIADYDKVHLGVIPTGTGNDFARNLGIKGTTEEIVHDILNSQHGTKLDLGVVYWGEQKKWKRLFNISSGVGLDALVCKKAMTSKVKKIFNFLHLGKLSYLVLTVMSLFSMKTYGGTMKFGKNPECSYEKVVFTAAMNLRAEGGGVPMAPSSNPCDGLIPFCIVADIPGVILPLYLIRLVLAKHETLKCFHMIHDTECYIHTDTPAVLHADGEYLADVTDVWYECMPCKLELLNTIQIK